MIEQDKRTQDIGAASLEVVSGDLLSQDVDVIVNAWNQNVIPYQLLVTQGVSGAIKRRTGNKPFDTLRKEGPMKLGDALITDAPNLPFKGIIHVAGINHLWRSSEASVRASVRNALSLASAQGYKSIAFPAIGAGSSITLPSGRELPVWGLSTNDSLRIIEDEARKSSFNGKIVIVRYQKAK